MLTGVDTLELTCSPEQASFYRTGRQRAAAPGAAPEGGSEGAAEGEPEGGSEEGSEASPQRGAARLLHRVLAAVGMGSAAPQPPPRRLPLLEGLRQLAELGGERWEVKVRLLPAPSYLSCRPAAEPLRLAALLCSWRGGL